MVNSTSAPGNVTLIFSFKVDDVTRNVFLITSLLCFTFFFYFIGIMLKVFFATPHMQENPRYILFVHMLINDTLFIISTNYIVLSYMYSVYLPRIVCFIIQSSAGCIFLVTPYNLAVMSLERYVAICFPLRHSQLCTPRRAKYAIVVIWVTGLSISSINLIAVTYFAERTSYFIYDMCAAIKVVSPIQNIIRTFNTVLSFTVVAIIIVFTYINVMLVARKVGSGGSSAAKAGKTVMLHAFQLILCLIGFIATVTETYVKNYPYSLLLTNHVLFKCLPRLLSPVIYGVRDETFRKYIRKHCTITPVSRPQ